MNSFRVNRGAVILIYIAALIGIVFTIIKLNQVFGGSISMSPGRLIPQLYLNLIFYLTETLGVVAAACFLFKGKIKLVFIIQVVCAVGLFIQVPHLNSIFNSKFNLIYFLALPYYILMALYLFRVIESHKKSLQSTTDAPTEKTNRGAGDK